MAFLTRFRSRGVPEPTSRRVALYSHDTQGLGHIRRQLGIASALSAAGAAGDLLLLSGAREACGFPLPPRADCVTLPSLHKEATESYRPRLLTTRFAKWSGCDGSSSPPPWRPSSPTC